MNLKELVQKWQRRNLKMGRQFTPNRVEIIGSDLRIYLEGGAVAIADAKFYETIRHFRWHFNPMPNNPEKDTPGLPCLLAMFLFMA